MMPPDGYTSLTVSEELFERLVVVMTENDRDSIVDAVETASTVALSETKPNWRRSWPISWQSNPG